MTFTPLGESSPITLTLQMIAHDIATPTKSGKLPSEGDCLRFANLCRGRELNPWTGDCFMIGFDSQNGPTFELITSYQALLKRAERSPNFDGLEGGIVVQVGEALEHRVGCLRMDGERIVGGWAKAYRSDRRLAHEAIIDFKIYDTGRSRWKIDPAGMIAKCAKAAALREAFPNTVGGLYVQEEMDHVRDVNELGAVMEPQRIAAVTRGADPVGADKPQTTAELEIVEPDARPIDWAAEFKRYGVMDQGTLLRDAPTAEDRASVLSAAKDQVNGGTLEFRAYDCLSRYNDDLATR